MIHGYDDIIFGPMIKTLLKPSKPIKHQETCPICGAKRVNIYKKEDIWKCKKCWDKGASFKK